MNVVFYDNSGYVSLGNIIMNDGEIKPLRMSSSRHNEGDGIVLWVMMGDTIADGNYSWFAILRNNHLLDLDEIYAVTIDGIVIPIGR
jgi:hypothetical protein